MIFLNLLMLGGLAALAIPILIHLLNRRRARPVEWGAMRFLRASLAAQSRRLLVEELLLLALRCLAVTLVVLAMARPFLPSKSAIPWTFVLPAVLAAAICAGMAAALWNRPRPRRRLLAAAGVLIAAAVLVSVFERHLQFRRWGQGEGARDLMIVLDASTSMRALDDGRTTFERAVDEARGLVRGCRSGDAVGLLLAGAVPQALVRTPTADHDTVLRALGAPECRPLGGAMGVLEALNAAAASLAEGRNPAKAIVLITDGQTAGWDLQSEARWKFVQDSLGRFPTPPEFICRVLPFPSDFRNAAVADLSLSRRIVGLDRPVKLDVRVANPGATTVKLSALDLFVDGSNVTREVILKELPPGASEGFRFEHRFETPGYHVVRAELVCDDDLPADNVAVRAVDVLASLPVLLVDGAPAERFFQGATGFLRLALTPQNEESPAVSGGKPVPFLIAPKVVSATALPGALKELPQYRVVVLANVARLPASVCEPLAEFVREGGGLLLLPGQRSEPQFYSLWRTAAGDPLSPALMYARRASLDEPARPELRSFTHPALQLVADPRVSDVGRALVRSFWKLAADPRDPAVRLAGQLSTGEPFLVERQVGKGCVLMASLAFDHRDSNLPSLKCFVPLVHELVYYLAAPLNPELNLLPGEDPALELVPGRADVAINRQEAAKLVAARDPGVTVLTPTLGVKPARFAGNAERVAVRFAGTHEPGLYSINLPPQVAPPAGTNAQARIPFAVVPSSAENTLAFLSDADESLLRARVPFFKARTAQELLTALRGEVPGEELWKLLAAGALLALLGEIALSRWIALQRRLHATETVAFRSPAEAAQELQDRARAWVSAPQTAPETVDQRPKQKQTCNQEPRTTNAFP